MKQFLAFAGGTLIYAASKADVAVVADAPNNLAEGAIGLFALHGTTGKLILVDGVTDLADVKSFFVARGLAAGSIISDEIERKSLNVKKNVAVATTKKVVTVGAIPATYPAGTVVSVGVVKEALITTDNRVKRGEYVTKAANESAATIAAALVASLNKKKDLAAVATVSGNNILLTEKDSGEKFSVFVDGALSGVATVTTTTQGVRPEGDLASLLALQLECEGYQGVTNYVDRTTGPTASGDLIVTNGLHVVYNLSWTGTTTRLAVATDPVAQRFKRLYLAIPTGATAITILDTMLGATVAEEIAGQLEEVGA